jgi:2-amino-4-hydroxy-6-hydroxymethyldihydropteridine diphosphokinase
LRDRTSRPGPRVSRRPAIFVLSVLCLALSAGLSALRAEPLTILHSNDTHGHLLPFSYPEAAEQGTTEAELGVLPGITRVRLSSLWRSAPLGPVANQPWFVNACAELSFRRAPEPLELLAALLAIEARAGRDRAQEVPAGPRPLDLDLLVWGPRVLSLVGPPALDELPAGGRYAVLVLGDETLAREAPPF